MTDSPITTVDSFHFLGTTITQDLKWEPTISSLTKKAQQRMYFLLQLRKAKLPVQMMGQFCTAIIESILSSSITVWYAGATARDKQRLQRIVRSAEKGCNTDFHLCRTCTSPGLWDEQIGSQLTLLTLDMDYLSHSPQAGGYDPSGPEPPNTRIVSFPLPLDS